MINNEELLNLLKQKNKLNTDQEQKIKELLEKGGKTLEEIVISEKMVDTEELTQIKAEYSKLPYISLANKKIDETVLNRISKFVADNYKVICFDIQGEAMKVGFVDHDNFKAIEAIDFLAKEAGLSVEHYLMSKESFKEGFSQYVSANKEISSALETQEEKDKESLDVEESQEELTEVIKSAPVIRIVSVILRHAIEGGASDIHIEPLPKEVRVRYRIDGILHTSLVLPRNVHDAIVARIKVMANLKLDETRVPQDGRMRLTVNEKEFDFRVSTLPLVGIEKVAIRILDTSKGAPKLEELGYQGEQLENIKKSIINTEGIIIVCGPTGSGKSTTLFSIMNIMNKEGVNIATLEDPVEYQIKGINQSQVKPEIGYTFPAGLRSFLRQDPDIIMVGEIRDPETAELAIHAALTGHLVLSTLHTLDAIGTIARFIDLKIESFLVGATLKSVVAQRLTRKICDHCKVKAKLPEKYADEIKTSINKVDKGYVKNLVPDYDLESMVFYKGKGCPRCGNTGYYGRVAIAEILMINDEVKDAIINKPKSITVDEVLKNQNFVTIKQDGIIKALQGKTSIEEVLRVMRD